MAAMWLKRSYQLSERVVGELRELGVRPQVVTALQGKKGPAVYSGNEFQQLVAGLSPAPSSEELEAILKYCQLSWLRLERILPNRALREWVDAVVFALVVALLVRTFLFAPFKIPSGSMIPTIEVGDHIFATMYSYGLPVPFTDIKLFAQPVQRGDIVIFPYPKDPSVDYIKRVIARGGETVEVQGRKVIVNSKALDEPYAYYDSAKVAAFGDKCEGLSFCGPLTVPAGHLFVMGDNRLDSADSRVWGFVDETTVKGRGRIIYWSHDPREGLAEGYRLSRIGSMLH